MASRQKLNSEFFQLIKTKYVCNFKKENVLGLWEGPGKRGLEPPGRGAARAHACEWGRAVARAEGMKSPRGAICPSCYEFGIVAGAAVAARTSFCMQIM